MFPAAPNGGAAVVVRPRQPVGSTDLQRFSSTEPVNGHTKDASNSWERIMKSFDSAASDAHLSVGSAVRKNEQVNLRDQFSLAEYNNLVGAEIFIRAVRRHGGTREGCRRVDLAVGW
jgi:hypothetical protein